MYVKFVSNLNLQYKFSDKDIMLFSLVGSDFLEKWCHRFRDRPTVMFGNVHTTG